MALWARRGSSSTSGPMTSPSPTGLAAFALIYNFDILSNIAKTFYLFSATRLFLLLIKLLINLSSIFVPNVVFTPTCFRMESTGQPGRVHISEKTYQFLTEDYYVQQAEDYNG